MRYTYTLRLLEDNRKFFGPGVVQLLEQVAERGSLRSAATSMGMAYSKAWTIVKHAEDVLGFALIDSKKGGRNGGGAVVTAEGQDFLERYKRFDMQLRKTADEIFDEMFPAMRRTQESTGDPEDVLVSAAAPSED